MQSLSSRIWTHIVESNSYDDNYYAAKNSYAKVSEIFLNIVANMDKLSIDCVIVFTFFYKPFCAYDI